MPNEKQKNKALHNFEAEQRLLNIIAENDDAMWQAITELKPKYFYDDRHKLLFKSMIELANDNKPVDNISMYEHLRMREKIENVGGAAYINKILWVGGGDFNYYKALVIEKWMLRQFIQLTYKYQEKANNLDEDIFDFISKAISDFELLVDDVEIKGSEDNFIDKIPSIVDELAKLRDPDEENKTNLQTKLFPIFNKVTDGINDKNLIVISGKYKRAKTTAAMAIALDFAIYSKIPIGIITLEMDEEDELDRKLISMMTGTRYGYLRNPSARNKDGRLILKDKHLEKIMDVYRKDIKNAKVYISDKVMNEFQMKAKIKEWIRKKGVGLVVIDYLQLIPSTKKYERKELEVSEMTRHFKLTCKELGIPIILIEQENEEGHLLYGKGGARDADFWFSISKPIKDGKKDRDGNPLPIKYKDAEVTPDESIFQVMLRESRHSIEAAKFLCRFTEDGRFIEFDPTFDKYTEGVSI